MKQPSQSEGQSSCSLTQWPSAAEFLMNGWAVWGWDEQTDITLVVCVCSTCDRVLCGSHMLTVSVCNWVFVISRVWLYVWVFFIYSKSETQIIHIPSSNHFCMFWHQNTRNHGKKNHPAEHLHGINSSNINMCDCQWVVKLTEGQNWFCWS